MLKSCKSFVEITSRVHTKTIVFFSIAMNIGTVFTQISKNNNSNYWYMLYYIYIIDGKEKYLRAEVHLF